MSTPAERVQRAMESGNPYEAHEMMKTAFYRMRSKGDNSGAYDLCQEGAVAQLQAGEIKCGTDMGKLMLDAYVSDDVTPDEQSVSRVLAILRSFPKGLASLATLDVAAIFKDDTFPSPLSELTQLASQAAKWARKKAPFELVRKILTAEVDWLIPELGWRGCNLVSTLLIQAKEPKRLGEYLVDCAAEGRAEERDLFGARAVLQTLAAAKTQQEGRQMAVHARELVEAFDGAGKQRFGTAPMDSPLGRFCALFLEAIEREKPELGKMLLQAYRASLLRDPNLHAMAQQAQGTVLEGQDRGAGGLLGDIMKMFMS